MTDPEHVLEDEGISRINVDSLSSEIYRHIVTVENAGHILASQNGRIIYTNSEADRIFGYISGELRGQFVEVLIPQDKREQHIKDREAYAKDIKPRLLGCGRNVTGLRKDGTTIQVEAGLSGFCHQGVVCPLVVLRDVQQTEAVGHGNRP